VRVRENLHNPYNILIIHEAQNYFTQRCVLQCASRSTCFRELHRQLLLYAYGRRIKCLRSCVFFAKTKPSLRNGQLMQIICRRAGIHKWVVRLTRLSPTRHKVSSKSSSRAIDAINGNLHK